MRCAILLEKVVQRGDIIIADTYRGESDWANGRYAHVPSEREAVGTLPDTCFLTAGTYTVTAEAPQGKTLTVRAYSYDGEVALARFPSDGSAGATPLTFTIPDDRSMMFDFGFGASWDDSDISPANTKNVRIHDTARSNTEDVIETVAILPGEIPDSDTIAEGLCSKKTLTLTVPAGCEAFGFAEQTITIVRVLDLDLPRNRTIFKGRVTAVGDVMSEAGLISQEITCASALDFLDDTECEGTTEAESLDDWLGDRCSAHNRQVDFPRKYTFTCSLTAQVAINDAKYCTDREILHDVLTGGKYLTANGAPTTAEYKERWQNDITYIDIVSRFGESRDTPFKIGENLGSIKVEQTAESGVYSAVKVIGGVNSDGSRLTQVYYNTRNWQKYGPGRTLVIQAEDIRCTGPVMVRVAANTYAPSDEYLAAKDAIYAYAMQEASKLSTVPVKITLTAADLAAMGFTGYERFEVGNLHPLVYPPAGYYGQRVRITGIKRRLSDGKIGQITIESGEVPGKRYLADSLTAMMARLSELSGQISDSDFKQTEIAETKVVEQTGGLEFMELTQAEFDDIATKSTHTIYYVDDDGDIALYKGSYHISTGGGGGDEPYIETACVLTSEQQTEWAPDHALVPVAFRGDASVYYGQAPSRFVVQGNRAYMGLDEETEITEADIMSELTFTFRDGSVQTLKAFAYRYASNDYITMGVACVNAATGAVIGQNWNVNNYWVLPGSYSAVKIGFSVMITGFYLNSNGLLAPAYWIRLHVFADGTQAQPYRDSARDLPYISGCLFDNGQNVDFGSTAERGFASGISITTEPVFPNGGE